jgi:hypothetical protein
MDPSDLEGYLREICQHCWLALLASMQLRDLLDLANERAGELARSDVHRVWRLQCWQSTETILSSAAALSRLLWPPVTTLREQVSGARLRATLGVDGRSPLAEPCVRDHTQSVALDGLDSWLAAHADGDPGFDVASLKAPVLRCPRAARWMDPQTWVVQLFDTHFDLHRLVEEAARLEVLARDPVSLWPRDGMESDR